jgi:hypothetical protein
MEVLSRSGGGQNIVEQKGAIPLENIESARAIAR